MENVPDMALDREMFILRSMVFELESMGYSVQERVIDAWRYGVPQFRQRLILVAIQNGGKFDWPVETPRKVTLSNAISDLPPVEGGWRPQGGADGWMHYDGPRTAFQKLMREGVRQADMTRIFDHITRPVRADDFEAFELLDSESRYSDLPEHLKRYRDDIFDDKYKRLSGDDVSRTITAHIAKDGYWYIHPEQNRTITVREAARIQTFPDSFRFSGPPSAAFKQIGNAVPPRLGYAVGQAVVNALNAETASSQPSSETVGSALAQWFEEPRSTLSPWLRSGNSWSVMLGELLLDRTTALVSSSVWPLLSRFAKASDLLDREAELSEILTWLGRSDRLETAMNLARSLEADSEITEEVITRLVSEKLITQAIADLAQLAARSGEEPIVVTAGALRVATRFHKNALGRKNQRTAGRIAIARMVGFGASARSAQLALLQLGDDVCQPLKPKCSHCPLAKMCQSSTSNDSGAPEPKA